MVRIGITGHSNLTVESASLVADALRAEVAAHASDGRARDLANCRADLSGTLVQTGGLDQAIAHLVPRINVTSSQRAYLERAR